jgi:hypothetical protein
MCKVQGEGHTQIPLYPPLQRGNFLTPLCKGEGEICARQNAKVLQLIVDRRTLTMR